MATKQIELPEDLYARAERYSAEHELPLAEVVRRALEILLGEPPKPRDEPPAEWKFPVIDSKLLIDDPAEWSRLLFEDQSSRGLPRD